MPVPLRRSAAPTGPPAFRNRAEAGALLGAVLREVLGDSSPTEGKRPDAGRRTPNAGHVPATRLPGQPHVLAVPRGGVPVAVGVARALNATLDVLVVRKIGHPDAPELGLGAIAEGAAEPFFDQRLLDEMHLTRDDLAAVVARERAELARRAAAYGSGRAGGPASPGLAGAGPVTDLAGQLVIVVDDGLATGVTARAALRAVRSRGAARTVLAVPVGAASAVAALRGAVHGLDEANEPAGTTGEPAGTTGDPGTTGQNETGEVVTVVTPRRFRSVGEWYADFGQLTDADVLALLSSGA